MTRFRLNVPQIWKLLFFILGSVAGTIRLIIGFYMIIHISSFFTNEEGSMLNSQNRVEGLKQSFRESIGVFDKYRLFRTHSFIVKGDKWQPLSTRKLCLGAQTSVDRAHHLVELAESFTGPLSISMLTPDIELLIAIKYISFLRNCFPFIKNRVSFHFTIPRDHDGILEDLDAFANLPKRTCLNHTEFLKDMVKLRSEEMLSWRDSFAYPQNLLRNVAKNGCQTDYTYIPDVDMVLIPGMADELETFLINQEGKEKNWQKSAYVIPTYEILDNVDRLPRNKSELLELISEEKAQQFHLKIFAQNQRASNLTRWEEITQRKRLDVSYKVKYEFFYEPLYVARGETPPFDERFIGFGMTRNTQAYEMFVDGYNFYVLNNAFTTHWGFQEISQRPPWRAEQLKANQRKFDEFALEVSARYAKDPYDINKLLKKLRYKEDKEDDLKTTNKISTTLLP